MTPIGAERAPVIEDDDVEREAIQSEPSLLDARERAELRRAARVSAPPNLDDDIEREAIVAEGCRCAA